MIRFLFLNVFIALNTIFWCTWAFFLTPFDRKKSLVHRYAGVPWARCILFVSGVKVISRGVERIDPAIPRIYMCNHQSYFDILTLLACLPVGFKFIMKKELMKIPLLGFTMKSAGYIGIVREDPRQAVKSMNEAAEKIRNGASVLIFPEGTRSPDGRLQEFKKGGFNLALRACSDIVPIAITGSFKIVPKGSLTINRGTIRIGFGEAISIKDCSKHDMDLIMEKTRNAMLELMQDEKSQE